MPAGSCLLSHGLESGWGPGSRSTRAACACCDQPAAWSPSTPASHGSQGVQRPLGLSPYPPAVHTLSLSCHACPASLQAPRLLVPGPHLCTRGRPSVGSRDAPPPGAGATALPSLFPASLRREGCVWKDQRVGWAALPSGSPHGPTAGPLAPPPLLGVPIHVEGGLSQGKSTEQRFSETKDRRGALWARGPRPRRAGGALSEEGQSCCQGPCPG